MRRSDFRTSSAGEPVNNLEVRSAPIDVDGRSVRTVVPFGEFDAADASVVRLPGGAFARSVTERGGKLRLFAGDTVVGRAVDLVERDDGLHVTFDLDPSAAGAAALDVVRTDGARLLALLRPIRHARDGDVDVVHEAALMRFDLAEAGGDLIAAPHVIPRGVAERRLALLDY